MNSLKFFIFIFLSNSYLSLSQDLDSISFNKKWFASLDFGVQMSGIKSEDFISSNYSPLIRLTGGKWLNDKIVIQVGYQGRYFNTIENLDKRFYNFSL